MMEQQLRIVGVLLVGLALLHAGFPRYFNWAGELKPLSLINRQMVYVHTLFIALVVLLMGLLCLTSAADMVGTPLGRKLALGCQDLVVTDGAEPAVGLVGGRLGELP